MDSTKEDTELPEHRPLSPNVVSQHKSEEAFKIISEPVHNACLGGDNSSQTLKSMPSVHRRSQSEVLSQGDKHSGGFQKLKNQMQKAWRWGGNTPEPFRSFNPEVLANQKRQWYQLHSRSSDVTKFKEPASLFEHFIIMGLHPDVNLETVEDAFARRKKWEFEAAKHDKRVYKALQSRLSISCSMEPQILFKYPPGKRLPMRVKDLGSFCFPEGVKTHLLERTPSLSELNEIVYGQEHNGRDDLAFLFSLKVGDNDTLYGVCLHVTEIVQRPPGILGNMSPVLQSCRRWCRFLVAAPRCYCVLTRVPFFELHYEMLNSIIAQERLNRITQFVNEMSLSGVPLALKTHDQMNTNVDCPDKETGFDWTASAIPVDSALALTAAAAGIISDDEVLTSSPKTWDFHSSESCTASEASDLSHVREVDKDGRKNMQYCDDCASESSESRSDALERMDGNYENGQASPDILSTNSSRSHTLERQGSFDTLFSPVRSMLSEDEDDELFANREKDFDDDLIMEWAKENKNELLQIICGYHSMALPKRGSQIVFQPLEHLQAIVYRRPSVSDLGFLENFLTSVEAAEIKSKLAAAEDALALSIWTTATICRVLSLESILALLTGVLLEKQVVVVCENLGVLSAAVLSLVPMIRPFQWQSLFLPILPGKMLDFLDAPVPFIVGVQQKPEDWKMKTNFVHVNMLKDQVKTCHLPSLPRYKELVSELAPFHSTLSFQGPVAKKHPVYKCNEVQAEAATQFLNTVRRYLESICSDLRSHTITNVQSNNDRVCLLLKDSFIDSFPSRDRPFIKLLVDTQLFAVLSDQRLSSFEHGGL